MRRMLKILVYGVFASAQLAVTLLLIGHYTHGAAHAVPAPATHTAPLDAHPAQAPAASIMPSSSTSTPAGSVVHNSAKTYYVAPALQVYVDRNTFRYLRNGAAYDHG